MRYLNAPTVAYGEDRKTYIEGSAGVTASQTVFNVSYNNGRVDVYKNGLRLLNNDGYTKTSSGEGTTITLSAQLGSGNKLELIGYQDVNPGTNVREDNFLVGTSSSSHSGGSYAGSTTDFPVAHNDGDLVTFWLNGVRLKLTTDFTLSPTTNVVSLNSSDPASSGDEVCIEVIGALDYTTSIPIQTSHSGKFLKTDGSSLSWDSVEALPSQSGNSGYFLTTDGTAASWAVVDALPSQSSHAGKFLTTDGTNASWADASTDGQLDTTFSADKTIASGKSLIMAGPVTVASGVTLTVNGIFKVV